MRTLVAFCILASICTATARADEPAPDPLPGPTNGPTPGPTPAAIPGAAPGAAPAPAPPHDGYSAAVARWRELAGRGDRDAALQLGLLYDTGKGVPQDFATAAQWYRQAADAGSAPAAFNLGALYDSGKYGARNAEAAYHWYSVAAGRGFARAAYLLGMMAEAGDGTAADPTTARKWYRQAAADGVPAARARLAAMAAARASNPAPPAPPAAAGEQQFARAVAAWRAKGLKGGGPKALAQLQAAAANGYPLAEYDLAYAYEHGVGLEPDAVRAYAWYELVEKSDAPPTLKSSAAANRARIGAELSDDERHSADMISTQLLSPGPAEAASAPAQAGH